MKPFNLIKVFLRRRTPVLLGDLSCTNPVSREFGLDRGTPIDRYYIERFLNSRRSLISGHVLEVGSGDYTRLYGAENVVRSDVLGAVSGKAVTIVGDLSDSGSLPDIEVDCFLCTQTFNFIYDVQKAVAGAYSLLKPGGVLLATVAGLSQISQYDMDRWGDYWRFTTKSVQQLFEPVFGSNVEIESHGNVLSACALLQGVALEDLPDHSLLDCNDPDYQVVITVVARRL